MFHSIKIGTRVNRIGQWVDTWETLGLIPTSPPVVSVPAAKTNWVEIPGRSGAVDLTETVTGSVQYGMRSGSWNFVMVNDSMTVIAGATGDINWMKYQGEHDVNKADVPNFRGNVATVLSRRTEVRYREIVQFIHGKYFKVILEDEPDYYYEGRLQVGNLQKSANYSGITISYEFLPYKTKVLTQDPTGIDGVSSAESYPFDLVNFEARGISYGADELPPQKNGKDVKLL